MSRGTRLARSRSCGESGQQQTAGAAVVVMAADDEIKPVLVGVVDQCAGGRFAVDDLVADVHAGPGGAVGDLGEGGLQVAVGGVGGLDPVHGGLGVGGGVGDRDGDKLGLVAAGDVDRDIKRAEGEIGTVPGKQDSLEHQRRMGTRDRAMMRAASM